MLEITFDNPMLNTTDVNNWDDTWMFRIGGEYQMSPDFALRAGYIWDETPIPDSSLKPLLPGASRNEMTLGFGYNTLDKMGWGKMTLDFALQYLWFADRSSTFALFPADYSANALIIGFMAGFQF